MSFVWHWSLVNAACHPSGERILVYPLIPFPPFLQDVQIIGLKQLKEGILKNKRALVLSGAAFRMTIAEQKSTNQCHQCDLYNRLHESLEVALASNVNTS